MKISDWLAPPGDVLGSHFPMPLDRAFTRQQALDGGVDHRKLRGLVDQGLLRKVVRGVYAASQAPDSVLFRAQALALVIPDCAVVTDRTAAWLHGVPILERGAHLVAPPISVCETADTRVRRADVDGRRRQLLDRDVVELHGLRVTTPLRTGLDLGRSLWRFDALAAIDGVLRIGVDHDELLEESERFKGHRGVVQLRCLAPLADGRSESAGESALRLHWYDAGLPRPEPQFRILDDWGQELYRLDVPHPDVRYAAEYDGQEFHSRDEDVEHDAERREWISRERGWTIDAFEKDAVYGRNTDITLKLKAGFVRARRSRTIWVP
ncbi:MAG TPA: hypothetical protein VHO29_13055 [Marmoricola sp.]|nr:hypothetical protein [Marmoricola sp.]